MIHLPLWYVAAVFTAGWFTGWFSCLLFARRTHRRLDETRMEIERITGMWETPLVRREPGREPWPDPSEGQDLPVQYGTKAEHERRVGGGMDRPAAPAVWAGEDGPCRRGAVVAAVADLAARVWVWALGLVPVGTPNLGPLQVEPIPAAVVALIDPPAPVTSAMTLVRRLTAERGEMYEPRDGGRHSHEAWAAHTIHGTVTQRRPSRAEEQRLAHLAWNSTTQEWEILPPADDLSALPEIMRAELAARSTP